VYKPRIFLSGQPWQFHYQRFIFSRRQPPQNLFNFFESAEIIKTRSACANLADRLRATQHQHAHRGDFLY
jgi:hypothetical protein